MEWHVVHTIHTQQDLSQSPTAGLWILEYGMRALLMYIVVLFRNWKHNYARISINWDLVALQLQSAFTLYITLHQSGCTPSCWIVVVFPITVQITTQKFMMSVLTITSRHLYTGNWKSMVGCVWRSAINCCTLLSRRLYPLHPSDIVQEQAFSVVMTEA